jgi:hypothetical protein
MLKVIQYFGRYCSCYFQDEYVLAGHFWKPYIDQAAEWDITNLIGRDCDHHELIAACFANQICYILHAVCCLPYIRLPKIPEEHTFTLKTATAMFAEMSNNFQHLTWLIPENLSFTKICIT